MVMARQSVLNADSGDLSNIFVRPTNVLSADSVLTRWTRLDLSAVGSYDLEQYHPGIIRDKGRPFGKGANDFIVFRAIGDYVR